MNKQEFMAMSLPFSLKCTANGLDKAYRLKGIFEDKYTLSNSSYGGYFSPRIDTIKPILRPLSDLINPCLNERFIPIAELLKIEQNSGLKYAKITPKILDITFNENSEGNTYELKYQEPYTNMEDGIIIFSYSEKFRRFGKVMLQPYKQPLGIGFQLDMFQQLVKWHFDIFGLIESGEAVDYHTLPDFVF